MEEVLSRLGPNRVSLSIKSNEFYEVSHFQRDKPKCELETMFDPICFVRSLKSGSQQGLEPVQTKTQMPVQSQAYVKTPVDKPKETTTSHYTWSPSGNDSLYMAFAQAVDPTLELFTGEEKKEKIAQFKDRLVKTYDLKAKELGIKKSAAATGNLVEARDIILYLSKLFTMNVLFRDKENKMQLFKNNDGVDNKVNVLEETTDGKFTFKEDISMKESYARLCHGIDDKLVKEVREIALMVGVPIYGDNKKLVLKKPLVDSIKAYV